MLSPRISIITPIYNSQDYIEATIKSVCDQTYTDWELIVIDDFSIDKSAQIIEAFTLKDSRIKLIKFSENSGAALARNKGIHEARGRYIAFLDSDDFWLPDKLEKQLEFMQLTGSAFSYTKVSRYDAKGNFLSNSKIPDKVDYSTLLKTNVVVCSSAMYDVARLGKVFMPNIRKRQDFALWLSLLKRCDYGFGLQEILVNYRVRDGSVSSNKVSAAGYTWRVYRDIEKLGLMKSFYYFSYYAMNAFIRIKLPKLALKLGLID